MDKMLWLYGMKSIWFICIFYIYEHAMTFLSRPPTGSSVSITYLYQSTPYGVFGWYYIPLSVDHCVGLYQSVLHTFGRPPTWVFGRPLRGLLHCSYDLLWEIHLYQYKFRPFNLGISVFHFICEFDIITINKRLHLLIDYAHIFRLMNTLTQLLKVGRQNEINVRFLL